MNRELNITKYLSHMLTHAPENPGLFVASRKSSLIRFKSQ